MPAARFITYIASVGVAILAVWSLVVRPPTVGWAVAALGGYVALITCGVLFLRWRVFVDAVVRGPAGARGVALTFDDGPHPFWTARILALLKERGAIATFFVVGRKVEAHPDIVRAIVEDGHAVELHSYAHDRLMSLRSERRVREDLERGISVLQQATGRRPTLFRPPVGHTNPIVARVAEALELTVVGWTVAGRDGVSWARPSDVAARVQRDVRDGSIVLLHDAAERDDREPAAVQALPAILDAIAAEGLPIVPLGQWIAACPEGASQAHGNAT